MIGRYNLRVGNSARKCLTPGKINGEASIVDIMYMMAVSVSIMAVLCY